MKIAILSESAYPVLNGVSVSTDTLACGLSQLGHELLLICPQNPNLKEEDENSEGQKPYKIKRTPSNSIYKAYPLPYYNKKLIYNILNEFKPNIVHAQIPFTYGSISKAWCRDSNVPFVTVNHTLYVDYLHYTHIFKSIIKPILIKYLKNFYNTSDMVITPSIMMKEKLISYGVTKNIEVIPTGINIPSKEDIDKTMSIKEQLLISPNDKVIIYLSRIAKEKNIYMLIDAFNMLFKEVSGLKLMICGGGPLLHDLVSYKDKLECREHIIFTGMIKKENVNDYLYCGDIFAFPSYTETQGLAVLEAMACGLAVVAVNEGGVPEAIHNNIDGVLCKNNATNMKNKLKELLTNENLRRNIQEKAKTNAQTQTVERMIEKYNNLYISLCQK